MFKSKVIYFILGIILIVGCIIYYRAVSAEFSGDISIPAETIEEETSIALSAGEYTLAFTYSSDIERSFSIYNRDGDTLFSDIIPAGSGLCYSCAFINPEESCRIYLDASAEQGELSCEQIILHTNDEIYNDSAVKAILMFVLGICIVIFAGTSRFRQASATQKCLWALLLASVAVYTFPLWTNTLRWGFDGNFHCTRIAGIADAMSDGQFPATIYPYCCNGFGMLGRIYPQLFLYPVAILRNINVSVVGCFQIFMILSGVASAVIMYLSVRSVSGSDISASAGSILFVLAIYHFDDVYYRNALGEATAMIFIPLVVAGLYNIISSDSKTSVVQLVIGCTGIIQSHVVSCIMIALMGVVFILAFIREMIRPDVIKKLFCTGLVILLLNIPVFISIITYIKGGLNTGRMMIHFFSEAACSLKELFNLVPSWFPSMGRTSILCFVLLLVYCCMTLKKKDLLNRFIRVLLMISIIFTFVALNSIPWMAIEQIPVFRALTAYLQFPYRLFSVSTVTLSFGVALALCELPALINGGLKSRIYNAIWAICILAAFCFGILYVCHQMSLNDPDSMSVNRMSGDKDNKFVLEYMPSGTHDASFYNDSVYTSNPSINTTMYDKKGTHIKCQFYVSEEYNHFDFPLFYYPGYKAKYYVPSNMDGVELPVTRGDEGRIRVVVPKTDEVGALEVYYDGVWYFKVGYIVSIVTLIMFILWVSGMKINHKGLADGNKQKKNQFA